jgi:phosphohistidine phosphatase
MDLLLVRHARAEDVAASDAQRALTPEGRERFSQEVVGLRALELELDAVLSSPLLRARQTAELLVPLSRGPVQECAALGRSPGEGLLLELREVASQGEHVALVGHEPWISELCAWLLCGERERGSAFAFKKGGAVWLRGTPEPGGMSLVAGLPPRVLRALGREQ